ncbi:MAG: HU family DNA-binding protein [Rhizobiales bacterium]|jgi:DNA-binding protein HU-beta|nr:HU family DNA-binding protein [Hyphomicrobiales bacterium]OJY41311.1 MAG: DNA-binding protein [Rhizobiales bacterium 64-17]
MAKAAAKAAPKAKAGAVKASKPVTLKDLANRLAEDHELTKKQGQEMLTDLVGLITKHLKKGERVKIVGLGVLQVRKRAARMGRNPMTGEQIHIKAKKKVAFRASKELKEAI